MQNIKSTTTINEVQPSTAFWRNNSSRNTAIAPANAVIEVKSDKPAKYLSGLCENEINESRASPTLLASILSKIRVLGRSIISVSARR